MLRREAISGSDSWDRTFTDNFVSEKVLEWTKEIEVLPTQLVNLMHPMHAILMDYPASGPFSAGHFPT